jgi:hypothetical protein
MTNTETIPLFIAVLVIIAPGSQLACDKLSKPDICFLSNEGLQMRSLMLSQNPSNAIYFHGSLFNTHVWLGVGGSRLVIPATRESEIRRIEVQSQPRQRV